MAGKITLIGIVLLILLIAFFVFDIQGNIKGKESEGNKADSFQESSLTEGHVMTESGGMCVNQDST